MNKKLILKNTERFVKNLLSDESTGHDWPHIERVSHNASFINKSEQGDSFVIELATLLHDVGDYKVINKEEDDYSIAENFLRKQNVTNDVIERVMFIIKHMSFNKSGGVQRKNAPIEFYVVQDADRLDALGAIGIARTFAYGGSKGNPLDSSIQHFAEKLLLLKDLMNTKTARKIADKRTRYMVQYLEQYHAERLGKK